jgi:hypothetical protein
MSMSFTTFLAGVGVGLAVAVLGLPRLSGRVEGLLDYAAMAAAWRCSCS